MNHVVTNSTTNPIKQPSHSPSSSSSLSADTIKESANPSETTSSLSSMENTAKKMSKSAVKRQKEKRKKEKLKGKEDLTTSIEKQNESPAKLTTLRNNISHCLGFPKVENYKSTMYDLLSSAERGIVDSITSVNLDSEMKLSDYFCLDIFKTFNSIKVAGVKDLKEKNKLQDELLKEIFNLHISSFVKFHANVIDVISADFLTCATAISTFFCKEEEYIARILNVKDKIKNLENLGNSKYKNENSPHIKRLNDILQILEKLLRGRGVMLFFTSGFLRETPTVRASPKNVLKDLIDYTAFSSYLSKLCQKEGEHFEKLIKSFGKFEKKIESRETPRKQIKQLFSITYKEYSKFDEDLRKEVVGPSQSLFLLRKMSGELPDPTLIYQYLFHEYFLCFFRNSVRIFEGQVVNQMFPRFLSRSGYVERLLSNLSNILFPKKEGNPKEIRSEHFGQEFSNFIKKIQKEIQAIYSEELTSLKNDNVYLGLKNCITYFNGQSCQETIHLELSMKKNIEAYPKLLEKIKELHKKCIEEIKAIHGKSGLSRDQTKVLIAQLKEVTLHSCLGLARYTMVIADLKNTSKLNVDPILLTNCEKNSTPQELIDLICLDGVEEALLPREKSKISSSSATASNVGKIEVEEDENESSEDEKEEVDEKKGDAEKMEKVKQWSMLAFKPTSSPLQYPSRGTSLDGIRSRRDSIQISRNAKSREVRKLLRELGLYSRSGKGSHKVYTHAEGGGSVAVPHDLGARGTQLSIQNAVNELVAKP